MDLLTFDSFDKFGRKEFATRLIDTIDRFYPFYAEAFVLSLNAPFGSGKTSFLKMWKHSLENSEKPYKVIYINAWETDFDDEPIVPIISAMLESLGTTEKPLQVKLKKTLGTVILAANNVLAHHAGLDLIRASADTESAIDAQNIQKVGEEIFKEYSFKKDAFTQLKTALEAYVAKQEGRPLIVLVDELDRARPNYSVKFLETIKHIFSVKGICFVLAVDRHQLEQSVRQIYGEVEFENYYRRFITREAKLPKIDNMDLLPFLNGLSLDFFESGMKFSFKMESKKSLLDFIEFTCKTFKLVPRQIESFLRIFTQLMASTNSERYAKPIWVSASVVLIVISIKNPKLYEKIGTTHDFLEDFYKYISGFIDKNKRFSSYLMDISLSFSLFNNGHGWDNTDEVFSILSEYKHFDLKSLNADQNIQMKNESLDHLVRGVRDFGDYSEDPLFHEIYLKIEGWKDFLSS